VQCINPFPESVNLPSESTLGRFHPVQGEDSGPSCETTTESPRQRLSEGRRTTPHHAGTRDGHWANGVGNGERRGKAKLPPEVVQYLRAESVWTGGLRELRHLQENSPGVIAEVYRAKQDRRRPSYEQLRQGCAELRLYCRRWDSLRIGSDGLLTMSVASKQRRPEGERVVCPTAIRRELVWDTHKQAHAGAQNTAPVVLALHGARGTAQSEIVRSLPGQQAWPSP